jgi:hypothetical protein
MVVLMVRRWTLPTLAGAWLFGLGLTVALLGPAARADVRAPLASASRAKGNTGTVQGPDGPCRGDGTTRYVDCGNGTVTDTVTGLIWLKQTDCLGTQAWTRAMAAAAALKAGACSSSANPLKDHSASGDWRLPTFDEWTAMIAQAVAMGCVNNGATDPSPSLTNDAGTACYGDGKTSSFAGVTSADYWSSTTEAVGIPRLKRWDGSVNPEVEPLSNSAPLLRRIAADTDADLQSGVRQTKTLPHPWSTQVPDSLKRRATEPSMAGRSGGELLDGC